MKSKLLTFILLIGGLGYFAYKFNLLQKYAYLIPSNKHSQSDTLLISENEPNKKSHNKIHKGKRPTRTNQYAKLDQYAFNTPKNESKSIDQLASYLAKGASNDYEKARLAYAWMAKYISYDDHGYNSNDMTNFSSEDVLKRRKGVCEDFSNLYKSLCEKMGLEAIKIIGYAKGYGYTIGDNLKETDHAWNAVKIDGEWKLVDVTWGEGYGETVKGKLKSVKKYTSYWFATEPHEFLFKHLPENEENQYVSNPITKEEYESLAYVDSDLFELGIKAESILEKSLADKKYKAPEAFMPDYDFEIIETELNKTLSSSIEYQIKLKSDANLDITFINGKTWTPLKNENGYYVGTIKPHKGKLLVSAKLEGFQNSYWQILEYKVN
jgi:hypothetical protein